MTADKDALLREALPCVQYSVNKWAERACAIAQKSFRFPSGAVPTQQQVDETFDKWKQMERLATRITAALAEKDDGGWMPIENGGFTYLTVNKQDPSLRFRHFCKTPAHATHWMPELPLPTERKV